MRKDLSWSLLSRTAENSGVSVRVRWASSHPAWIHPLKHRDEWSICYHVCHVMLSLQKTGSNSELFFCAGNDSAKEMYKRNNMGGATCGFPAASVLCSQAGGLAPCAPSLPLLSRKVHWRKGVVTAGTAFRVTRVIFMGKASRFRFVRLRWIFSSEHGEVTQRLAQLLRLGLWTRLRYPHYSWKPPRFKDSPMSQLQGSDSCNDNTLICCLIVPSVMTCGLILGSTDITSIKAASSYF